jgi:hypothetical protein
MSTTVSEIITRAGIILHDTTKVRWQEDELLKWVNDAQNEIVLFRPDASVRTEVIKLTAGTSQALPNGTASVGTDGTAATIPPDGIRLIDVVRNSSSAKVAGNAITVVDRDVLDAQLPTWQSGNTGNMVKHYMFDLRNPKTFYVYPGVAADQYVEVVYSAVPSDAVLAVTGDATTGILNIPGVYRNAVLDYVLYRAYSKDADFAGNAQRALKHYEAFTTTLGLKFQVDKMIDPNQQDAVVPGPTS